MTPEQAINTLSKEIAEIVLLSVKNEFIAQGHNMTGTLLDSIKYEIQTEANSAIIEYSLLDYGMIQNYGVKNYEIKKPFARPRIEGLIKFVKNRMFKTGKEAEAIAFAIANKHKTVGMPTPESLKYSKTGSRRNWVTDGIKQANPKINETINRIVPEVISYMLVLAFAEVKKKDSKNLKILIQ
jgi:hypothetical protein